MTGGGRKKGNTVPGHDGWTLKKARQIVMASGAGLGAKTYRDALLTAPPRPGGGPNWVCSVCGTHDNWDSRKSCRSCGVSRNVAGIENKQEAENVRQLRIVSKELAELKAKTKNGQQAPKDEQDKDKQIKVSIHKLEQDLKRVEKEQDTVAADWYKQRLADARSKEAVEKPPRQLRIQLGQNLSKKEKKYERSKKKREAIEEQMADFAKRLLAASAEEAVDKQEVDDAQAEYDDFNRVAMAGGGGDQNLSEEAEADVDPTVAQAMRDCREAEARLQAARRRVAEAAEAAEAAKVDEGGDSAMGKPETPPAAPAKPEAAVPAGGEKPPATADTEPTPQAAPQAQVPAEPPQQSQTDTPADIRASIEAVIYDEILADLTENAKDRSPEQLAEEAKTKASRKADLTCQHLDEKRRKLEQRP